MAASFNRRAVYKSAGIHGEVLMDGQCTFMQHVPYTKSDAMVKNTISWFKLFSFDLLTG